ncbi:ATP-binding protein [bacterium]|nr:ATP-binding protein [bacterium]
MQQLKSMHERIIAQHKKSKERYLTDEIDWTFKAICIFGARGTGKTTLLVQQYKKAYKTSEKALYISADNIIVTSKGLLNIAQEYFALGGEALFIDEVHKYLNWSIEVKNIIDLYPEKKIIISGSSSIDLEKGKGDLSRRVLYYELKGLSFREFISFETGSVFPTLSLAEIEKNHYEIARSMIEKLPLLKYFKEYLLYGYYPYYIENKEALPSLLLNVVEKVIYEDIAVVKNISQSKLPALKKLIWIVASSKPFTPNLERISKELNISREYVYLFMEYLEKAGVFLQIKKSGSPLVRARKPEKLYINNTSLLVATAGLSGIEAEIGTIRETFFANQVRVKHSITIPKKGDFMVDNTFTYEIGGKNKTKKQIATVKNSFVVADDIEMGFGTTIPLYLFGFLY